MKNKVLQVGSGSMGTRRLRDLTARGDVEVALMEERNDRAMKARERFGIQCFNMIEDALAWGPDTITISTPPHTHAIYVETALKHGLHFFCEAELFPYDYKKIEPKTKQLEIIAAPSCTFGFLPICKELERIAREELGVLHAYSFCVSIDVLSWHPGEGMEYYARNRSTNGTREMVPFELIALSQIFSAPLEVAGTVRRGGELGQDYEDTWCLQMGLEKGGTGQLQVMGGCPHVARKGTAAGSNGIVEFDFNSGEIIRHFPKIGIDDTRHFGAIGDILESVYKEEIDTFIDAVRGDKQWTYSYRKANVISGALAAAEKSAVTGNIESVNPDFLPAELPDRYDVSRIPHKMDKVNFFKEVGQEN